jgi:membrane fusion protein, multidrug efflux system
MISRIKGLGWMVLLLVAPLACDKAPQWSGAGSGGKADAAVAVTLAPARTQAVQRSVEVVGTLWGDEDVIISAKVPGRIVSIFKDIGDRALSGEQLAQIDPTDYLLAVRQKQLAVKEQLAKLGLSEMPALDFDPLNVPPIQRAKLQVANAQAKYDRAKELTKDGSRAMSQQEVDDFKTAWDVANSDLDVEILTARSELTAARSLAAEDDIAQRALSDSTIVAPVGSTGGRAPTTSPSHEYGIAQRMVSVGEYVKEGTALFRLVADDPVKLRAFAPERYTSDVKLGQNVVLRVEAYADKTFEGKVSRINPQIDPNNRTFQIEVLVPNSERLLKPGSFARAQIQTRTDPKVVFVPQEAVVSFAGTYKVFTVNNGKAVEQVVETGDHQGELVEVTSGLTGTESVVVDGASKLATGVAVAPRNAATGSPKQAASQTTNAPADRTSRANRNLVPKS